MKISLKINGLRDFDGAIASMAGRLPWLRRVVEFSGRPSGALLRD